MGAAADLLLQRRPALVLVAVRRQSRPYISTVAREAGCTYAHTSRLVARMVGMGLLRVRASGRVKYLALTPEGARLAAALERVLRSA